MYIHQYVQVDNHEQRREASCLNQPGSIEQLTSWAISIFRFHRISRFKKAGILRSELGALRSPLVLLVVVVSTRPVFALEYEMENSMAQANKLANKQTSSSPLGGNSGRKVEKKGERKEERKEEGKKAVSNKDAEQQEQQTGHTSGLSGCRRCRRHFCVAVAVVSLF